MIYLIKFHPLLFLFFSTISTTFAQEINCEELQQMKPLSTTYIAGKTDSLIAIDLERISFCLDLDEVDMQIFSKQAIAIFILMRENTDSITYKEIISYITAYKELPEYDVNRNIIIKSNIYEYKVVDKKDWPELQAFFLEIGFEKKVTEEMKKAIYHRSNKGKTYKEALAAYWDKKEPKSNKIKPTPETRFMQLFRPMEPLEIMQSRARAEKKQLLLFFSGYSCVNARKMEEAVLLDKKVLALLKKEFTCYMDYVDDRTSLTEAEALKFNITDETIKTRGKAIIQLQQTVLQQASQPMFAIIGPDGKVKEMMGFNRDVAEFIGFLEKGRGLK